LELSSWYDQFNSGRGTAGAVCRLYDRVLVERRHFMRCFKALFDSVGDFARRSAGVFACAILLASDVSAQTTTATIAGRIVDSQGLALPGVTVTVAGPNLQGTLNVVSTGNGDYIIPRVPPGAYTVTFELGGFERQQKAVVVALSQSLTLNAALGPASLTENVTVRPGSGEILTHTPEVATNFTQELMAMLPTTRDINAAILKAPAVHPSGPNGSYSIAGAMSFESLYLVNGVNVNENLRGQASTLYIEDAVQEMMVATDGISAEYGRFSGGVVNVITKSGGNRFSGSFRDSLYNDDWRAKVTGNDERPFTTDSKVDRVISQYEYVLGGPIQRDRLWFFTAGRFRNAPVGRNTVAPLSIPYTFEDRSQRYEGKLTYSLNPSHRVDGTYTKVIQKEVNGTFSTGSSMDLRSLYTRELPQNLFTVGYSGVLSPSLFLEGRYSARHFSFIGSGATSTDLILGTLLIDSARGNLRYWAPTFCGVCDPEKRDNEEVFLKGTYVLSTKNSGSHTMLFGYDTFNDKRFANKHQSGSDYRILGTSSIVRGTDIYPRWLPGSTTIQFNPIAEGSQGTNFRTNALFFNDNWRWTDRLTLNVGVRWDKNQGKDSAGRRVADDSAISPRVGVAWDPTGKGLWSVTASFAKYVAGLNNSIADSSSAAGNPATIQYSYQGPAINPDVNGAALVTPDIAIQQLFAWFNANGGTNMTPTSSSVPGVSVQIPNSLTSPNVRAYAAGVSRQLTSRALVRADYSFRDYRDFYSSRIDRSTGIVVDEFGNRSDLAIIENTNDLKRRYSGVSISARYRINSRSDAGGSYTLARLWGNFDGENVTSGPLTTDLFQYPEYRQASWFAPEGDLAADQRHRASFWLNYGVPKIQGLTISVLQDWATGVPYGAGGGLPSGQTGFSASAVVDARTFVTNPGYATPQGGDRETYYYTARDAFRTEASRRTDLAANYTYRVPGGRSLDAFVQAQVLNVFNVQDLCACGADVFNNGGGVALSRIGSGVLTPVNTPSLAAFNPFTTTPVEGVNWRYNTNFGTPLNRFAFTSPRTFRMTFGLRF
jgi:outer membrane receptor for ferrienterochelin and colicin